MPQRFKITILYATTEENSKILSSLFQKKCFFTFEAGGFSSYKRKRKREVNDSMSIKEWLT